MPEFCQVERDGRIFTVTIDRPEVMNALHPPANGELGEVFDEFCADDDLWVAIITGAGDRAFSAGNDLKYQAGGGRMGLPLACDLIIASENAVFALPEPTVGTAALAGGMQRLPQQIPLKHAMGMLLTGRRVSAREGHALGFVNEVVPPDELTPAARRWAEEIAACAPLSVRATKQCAMASLDGGSVAENTSRRYDQRDAMLKSEDYAEGPRAFAEKRPPVWKGR
jgi:enoyl-CoA hydratase/carnithine racemase